MPSKLLYSPGDNLWLREVDGTISVGVPSAILALLGEPEFINLPAVGAEISPGVPFGALENSKSAFDLSLPFPCEVVAVDSNVAPGALIAAADGELALVVVRPHAAQWTDGMLDAAGYADFIAP